MPGTTGGHALWAVFGTTISIHGVGMSTNLFADRGFHCQRPSLLIRRLLVAITVAALLIARVGSAEPPSTQEQFESLRKRFEAEREKFFGEYQKTKTDDERQQLFARYPSNTMVEDFLGLEESCRGTQVGLSALHQLVSQAGGGGNPDTPVAKGRQKALQILAIHYADHSDLDVMFDWLMSGSSGPQDKPFLRRAADSTHRHVRATALLTLAQRFAAEAQIPAWFDANLALLSADPEKNAAHIKLYQELRSQWGEVDPSTSRAEAIRLLDQVIAAYGDVLEPPRTGYGPILLKIERTPEDQLTKKARRPLAARAESTRFELTHLCIGQPAPEIAGPDAIGNDLKLSDQRGKVTFLMFSFKGCGPCEAMYPDNRQLLETYRGRPFAILGVMGDETLDTVKEALADKKITWPLWWDGPGTHGPLATRWNVGGWPEIYVIDHRGIIRYRELRGDVLSQAVAQLVREAEQAK
jgi:peroxiredoxin